MELIDKSALVTEIEKVIDEPAPSHDTQCPWEDGYWCGLYKAESIIDTFEVKEVDLEKKEEKLNKTIKLADAMYDAAQQLTTDASRLHKAMQDWWNFKNINL
jgi:hypothetical protein